MERTAIKTRRDMAQYLNERMTSTYWDARTRQRLDKSMVKTYCIETHVPDGRSGIHDRVLQFLNSVCGAVDGLVRSTEEESFFVIQTKGKNGQVELFVDASDQRFWIVHSANRSSDVDRVTDRLIKDTPSLDRAWFPMEMLEGMTRKGSFRGMGLNFDRRKMGGAGDIEEESIADEDKDIPVEYLSLRLWGNKAGDVLRILRDKDAFPHSTTLSSVRIKHWLNRSEDMFALDDIKYNGKVTGTGTSFESHIFVVTDLYRKYKARIRRIENEYALRYSTNEQGGVGIFGAPFNFIFPIPIDGLERFCESLFTCSAPFRLWGIPTFVNDHYVRVSAVDLHVGCGLNFEISNEFMRVYLPEGSCGNTIARLYTNLQHYYDACVKIEIGDEKELFN